MKYIDIINEKISAIQEIIANDEGIESQTQNKDELEESVISFLEICNKVERDYTAIDEFARLLNEILGLNPEYIGNAKTLKLVGAIIKQLRIEFPIEELESDYQENQLSIQAVSNEVNITNCIYVDSSDLNKSLLSLNITEEEVLNRFLSSIIGAKNIVLLYLLKNIECTQDYTKMLLSRFHSEDEKKVRASIDFLKITQVLKGEVIYTPSNCNITGMNEIACIFDSELRYDQFEEIIEILNEYNIHNNHLDKYLRLYHIIENFMYKCQICILSKELDYRMFTMRDFRELNERVNKSELNTLKEFIKIVGEEEFDGTKYKETLYSAWNDLNWSGDEAIKQKIITCFRILKIKNNNGNLYEPSRIDKNCLLKVYADLIYKIRCSIVHNKVNEFHLAYSSLNSDIMWFMEKFIMPQTEKMIANLILKNNKAVYYDVDRITLY